MSLIIGAVFLVAATAAMQHHHGHSAHFPFPYHAKSPVPFELKLDQTFIGTTHRKVQDYRPTFSYSDVWNNEGPPQQNISEIADYWANEYDWRQIESSINAEFDHYATTVSGNGNYPSPIPLHFVHHRSTDKDAIPLLLIHGWPSTFLEWSKVIKPLTKTLHGKSFHIVAPDLPGFGFSPAPKQSGMGPREFGRALDALMHQLGYEKYGIVTTDLGWFTGMWMVQDVRESIIGHMTDFFMADPNADDLVRLQAGVASRDEVNYVASTKAWFDSHWSYATTHGQKPLALGAALADSPVGFLGWYWDVNHATSDGYKYSPGQLITDAMMLYIPGPYANMRAYHEIFKVSSKSL
jgi:pimeloyl-ACP methyl ester carboxylesterase